MADLSINANNPEPIRNNNNSGESKGRMITRWSNSIYTLVENGDGKIGWNDLKNEENRGKQISEAARETFGLINKFFEENKGKKWTNDLTNRLNNLLQNFNKENKKDDRKCEEYYDQQGNMTGYTHYDKNGHVSSVGTFEHDNYGEVTSFKEFDAINKLTYEEIHVRNHDGSYTQYSSVGDDVGDVFIENETVLNGSIISRPKVYREVPRWQISP